MKILGPAQRSQLRSALVSQGAFSGQSADEVIDLAVNAASKALEEIRNIGSLASCSNVTANAQAIACQTLVEICGRLGEKILTDRGEICEVTIERVR